jgi:hypothetical protein
VSSRAGWQQTDQGDARLLAFGQCGIEPYPVTQRSMQFALVLSALSACHTSSLDEVIDELDADSGADAGQPPDAGSALDAATDHDAALDAGVDSGAALDGGPDATEAGPFDPDGGPDAGEGGPPVEPHDGGPDGSPDVDVPPPPPPPPVCDPLPALAPQLGHALAVGDFDGDELDDIAVGNPVATSSAGQVCIYYGKTFQDGAFTSPCQAFNQRTPALRSNVEADDRFGASLAAGDLDGDGVDDLIIGSPGEGTTVGTTNHEDAGFFYVMWGVAGDGLLAVTPGNAAVRPGRNWWQGTDGTRGGAGEGGDLTSSSVAVLDIDSDGQSDVFAGAPGELAASIESGTQAIESGTVVVVPGHATLGVRSDVSYNWAMYDFGEDESFPHTYEHGIGFDHDRFGDVLLTAMLPAPVGGGDRALFIGAPAKLNQRGAVYMLFYDGRGTFSTVRRATIGLAGSEAIRFGSSLAFHENRVLIGAEQDAESAGRVYVADLRALDGTPAVWPAILPSIAAPELEAGPATSAAFGHSQAVQHGADGDYLLVGAPGQILDDQCQRGAVHRYKLPELSHVDTRSALEGDALFGFAVVAADLDGDGVQEAVASAPGGGAGSIRVWQ